ITLPFGLATVTTRVASADTDTVTEATSFTPSPLGLNGDGETVTSTVGPALSTVTDSTDGALVVDPSDAMARSSAGPLNESVSHGALHWSSSATESVPMACHEEPPSLDQSNDTELTVPCVVASTSTVSCTVDPAVGAVSWTEKPSARDLVGRASRATATTRETRSGRTSADDAGWGCPRQGLVRLPRVHCRGPARDHEPF